MAQPSYNNIPEEGIEIPEDKYHDYLFFFPIVLVPLGIIFIGYSENQKNALVIGYILLTLVFLSLVGMLYSGKRMLFSNGIQMTSINSLLFNRKILFADMRSATVVTRYAWAVSLFGSPGQRNYLFGPTLNPNTIAIKMYDDSYLYLFRVNDADILASKINTVIGSKKFDTNLDSSRAWSPGQRHWIIQNHNLSGPILIAGVLIIALIVSVLFKI